ncbi:peptide/nickel transport system permease protein [Saccharopolyspora antimicrobica]|uniref:Peptide/nickel transport system permease protein n=1 Tax=Saccharopolyspora antimicrobica TaxID=455193 RepID=A0A1I4VUU3_9PSEU|nr:ABC transporter permease [Saccharopolyspora antimicrobica]RKT87198.1 peptide/nickel transport system permease protein [Saccharopolyspora antimicrobica]SFN04962.1 peptide/nickel transport system permease protein [Saccharopolyspora antimicrobica]
MAEVAASAPPTGARSRPSRRRRAFFANRLAVLGVVVLGLFALIAVLAPVIAPYDPYAQDLAGRFQPPSGAHLLGQDELGRDILSRLLHGAGVTLSAGLLAVALATAVGTGIGLLAGYRGGWYDTVLMRLMDILLAFPSVLLAIMIVSALGPGLWNAMLAVGIVSVPQIARVVRSAAIGLRDSDYVQAARSMGAGHARILLRTLLPNCTGPLIVQSTLSLAAAILDIAALSFLGLGAQAPTPEWGAMLSDAFRAGFHVFLTSQFAIVFPGLAIAFAVLCVNFIGDGFRDVFDPKAVR